MSKWINLDPEALNREKRSERAGIEFRVGLSPYDVPHAVRAYSDIDAGRFVIQFKYLDANERRVPGPEIEKVQLITGEHSDRLYEIWINIRGLTRDDESMRGAWLSIQRAISKAASDLRGGRKRRHFALAREVISRKENELVAAE